MLSVYIMFPVGSHYPAIPSLTVLLWPVLRRLPHKTCVVYQPTAPNKSVVPE